MADPVARCFWFAEVEQAAIVAALKNNSQQLSDYPHLHLDKLQLEAMFVEQAEL
jgi:hypothetical protein